MKLDRKEPTSSLTNMPLKLGRSCPLARCRANISRAKT